MAWVKSKNGDWEFEFVTPQMNEAGGQVLSMWTSEVESFHKIILDLLASLPGGDMAEEMGGKDLGLGWMELEMIGDLVNAIKGKDDVEEMCEALLGPPEEEEESPMEEEEE